MKKHKSLFAILFFTLFIFVTCIFDNSSLLKVDAFSIESYITEATKIEVYGSYTTTTSNDVKLAEYSGSMSDSNYVVYRNAVVSENKTYDLIVYPFKSTSNARVAREDLSPHICVTKAAGHGGYKLVVTEHADSGIGSAVEWTGMIGFSDLDKNEYVILPNQIDVNDPSSHIGTKVSETTTTYGYKYSSTSASDNTSKKQKYDTNAIFTEITIPASGFTIYYGSDNNTHYYGTILAFDSFNEYFETEAYCIKFNVNGGTGSVPASIVKYGSDTSTVMGDIGSTVPTRTGYTFKGWSAASTFNSERISYSSSYGGSEAADGTTATQTSSSWTYADYCDKTGGDSSNRTLTLYAQWEINTSTLAVNPNGGTWNGNTSTQSFTQNYNTNNHAAQASPP